MSILNKKLTTIFTAAVMAVGVSLPAFAADAAHAAPQTASDDGDGPAAISPSQMAQAQLAGEMAVAAAKQDFKNRVVRLNGPISAQSTEPIKNMLRILDEQAPGKPITLVIDSPGGSEIDGMELLDVIKTLQSPVYTECDRICASMGAILLATGEPGHRSAMPHATVLIHGLQLQFPAGMQISYADLTEQMQKTGNEQMKMVKLLADYTHQPVDSLAKILQKDTKLTAEEAKGMGIIDQVIAPLHGPHGPIPQTFKPN